MVFFLDCNIFFVSKSFWPSGGDGKFILPGGWLTDWALKRTTCRCCDSNKGEVKRRAYAAFASSSARQSAPSASTSSTPLTSSCSSFCRRLPPPVSF